MFILYSLTFDSGKQYIGQTSRTMNLRITQHGAAANRGSPLPVHCAWRVHGAPLAEVLSRHETQAELNAAEIDAIRAMDTLAPNGYNVSLGGDTAPSKNPDVAAKIAASATGRKHADTSSWSAATAKQWQDAGARERMLVGMRGAWTDEMRKAAGERCKARWAKRKSDGWVMPESTKDKLRTKSFSAETRAKMSEAAKGKPKAPRSEATRQKLSDATKLRWQDVEHARARVEAIKRAWDAKRKPI